MEVRKWENLEVDCLVNILGRVGLESLLLDVPFVCKSWFKASLNPLCWKALVFPGFNERFWDRRQDVYPILKELSFDAFLKSTIYRSKGLCTILYLSRGFKDEILEYVVDKCPALKILSLSESKSKISNPELLGKFNHLEHLFLPYDSRGTLSPIVQEIGLNCENFVGLHLAWFNISETDASTIVTYLPELKFFTTICWFPEDEILLTLLNGCKDLVMHHEIPCCIDVKLSDKVSKFASRIAILDQDSCESFFDRWN